MVLLEFGVGFNAPGIIRFPFEAMAFRSSNAVLIRMNKHEPEGTPENRKSTVVFDECIQWVLSDMINETHFEGKRPSVM
ncbi:MAG: hypothetical protein JXB19_10955 [Bacteroidales bacterium]|nr:hypothetical protein [Bacteroidales bacterium]